MLKRRYDCASIKADIVSLEQVQQQDWDDFVEGHPEGRICHLVGYNKMIQETFGYTPVCWRLWDGERLAGVFPAFVVKPLWGPRRLLSQPFIEYGGPLVGNLPENSIGFLQDKIIEAMHQHKASYLEIHGGFGVPMAEMEPLVRQVLMHKYAILPLTTSKELWDKTISRHVCKAVRKAMRAGLECEEETTPDTLSRHFYPLYLLSMKRLGSPPFSLTFFLNTLKYLPRQTKLFQVLHERQVVAALLGFTTGQRVHIAFSVSNPKFWDLRPNDLVHWRFIEWAADHGYKVFDFGTVRYNSQRQFKEKWGVEVREYIHYYLYPSIDFAHRTSLNSSSRSVQLLSSLWRRWVPGVIAHMVGPLLHRLTAL